MDEGGIERVRFRVDRLCGGEDQVGHDGGWTFVGPHTEIIEGDEGRCRVTGLVGMVCSPFAHWTTYPFSGLRHQANATAAFAVDVDPQDTAAQWLPGHPQRPRVREVSELPGLSVLPSYVTLADDEYEAIEAHVSPGAIAGQLRDLCDPYDWVVMDLPPSLAFWSRVGYSAADDLSIIR